MAETVTELHPQNLPAMVTLTQVDFTPRFTPRELEMIKAFFEKPLVDVLSGDGDEKFTAVAWLKLRRDGYPVSLEAMLDVVIDTSGIATTRVDPSSGEPSTGSPDSVSSGG